MDLRSLLTSAGFLVVACGTKAGALATLRNDGFQLVIINGTLPDGTGLDVLQYLKSVPEMRHLRTILLGGEAELRSRFQGQSGCADRYVGKPYDRDYLARVARELCHLPMPSFAARRTSQGKKLLLVDTHPEHSRAAAEGLRSDGNEVVIVRSGEEALALLEFEPFACLILDLALPGIDGLETVLRVRRSPYGRDTRVLLLTGSDEQWVRQQALVAGADEVAVKTTIVELMRMRVSLLLMRRRRSDDKPLVSSQEPERA
jgi:DNA-binding response OmpR family regulator